MADVNSPLVVATEKEISIKSFNFLERVVLSPSLFILVKLFSSMSVNSGF